MFSDKSGGSVVVAVRVWITLTDLFYSAPGECLTCEQAYV
jgi:hypothetical protein